MNYEITFLGEAVHKEPIDIAFHQHSCWEMVFYTKGEGLVETERESYTYGENSVILMPPFVTHNERNYKPSCNLVLGFTIEYENNLLKEGHYSGDKELLEIIKGMINESVYQKEFHKEIIYHKLGETILYFMRNSNNKIKRTKSTDLSYVTNYIDENLSLPLTVKELSGLTHYSQDRFRHLFKENKGVSVKEYILEKKIDKAKVLLSETNKSIVEIAIECGFFDSAHFCKEFKKKTAYSPKEYRYRKK